MRELLNMVQNEEITFSRMVELLNERAAAAETSEAAPIASIDKLP